MGSPVHGVAVFEFRGWRFAGRPAAARRGRGSDAAVRHFEASAREMDQPTAKQARTANARDRHKSAGGGCHRYEFVEPQAET